MSELECIWPTESILGEGPTWVARERAIYFVDIVNHRLHRYGVDDGTRRSWRFEEQITSLAPRQSGGFVAGIRDGFAFFDLADLDASDGGARFTAIALPETDLPSNRFNDGKVDPQGRFWAGSMDEKESESSGVLYRLDGDLSLHAMDRNYVITNGPTFSPDGRVLYHGETHHRRVYAFDLADDGSITGKRIFVQLEDPAAGSPDGMTVDAEGCLWLCHFGGARMTRFSPEGEVLREVPLPAPNVTSCAFGGDDLDTLYITTARLFLDPPTLAEFPLAGGLFSYRPEVKGCPATDFAG